MAIKHNNAIPHNHFRKDWQRRVKCHFDQPGKKHSRRDARAAKAAKLAPRPVDKLRPVVRCPTIKYNRRARAGRGFTLDELKAAGIARRYATTIGISVDGRRKNLSEESLAANVERLKAYKARLIVFPKKGSKPKAGDSTGDDLKTDNIVRSNILPIQAYGNGFSEISKSEIPEAKGSAYTTLREARANKRQQGAREKRARDKAEAEANSKK